MAARTAEPADAVRVARWPAVAAPAMQLRPPRLRREPAGAGAPALLGRLLGDIPSLVRLVVQLGRDPRVSRTDKLLLAGALAYVAAPHDVIPDWIPVLGQLDDLLVVGLALRRLLRRAGPELLLEHWRGDPATLELLLEALERFGPARLVAALAPRGAHGR